MKVLINFVGDIALFNKYEQLNIDPIKKVWLPNADYNIGNFEFIIPNNREKAFYDVQDSYKCSYSYFTQLSFNKFNYLSLANNHCMDYGLLGVNDTINILKDKKVNIFGFGKKKDYSVALFKKNGISFCIIGVVKSGRWSNINSDYGPNNYDVDKIFELIKLYKTNTDHIIIYPHWGTELVDIPDPEDVKIARLLIEKGASAVIGHHPHVPQGIEKYQHGLICYSLGSFIYIPSEEVGFRLGVDEREISLCLNIQFNKNSITEFVPYYYKYDNKKMIPIYNDNNSFNEYIELINNNINHSELYYKKIRKVLLKREFYSFFERFRKSPFKTIVSYLKLIQFKHIKKILHRG